MTPIAELTALLMSSGLSPETITQALDLAQQHADDGKVVRQSADTSADRRRAYDRERQKKLREIRRQSADNPPTVTTPLTSFLPSTEVIESKKEEKKVRARKAPNAPLSADWQIKPAHYDAAEKLKIPRPAVHSKAEDMRLWAQSSGAIKADWDATFHGFLRRDAAKLSNGLTNGTPRNAILAALDELHAGITGDGGLRDEPGSDHAGLLPQGGGERPEDIRGHDRSDTGSLFERGR